MATDVTVDTVTDGGSTTGVASLAWNHTVNAGLVNGILVVMLTSGAGSLQAATGVNWDQLGTPTPLTFWGKIPETGNNCYVEIWYLLNPASGTKQVKASYGANVEITAGSISAQYVNQSTPWNAAGPQTNIGDTGTTMSVIVTSALHELGIVAGVENGGSVMTVGVGQTPIHNDNIGAGQHAGVSSYASGAATIAFSYTGKSSGNNYAMIGGSLQFDAGGGGVPPVLPPLFITPQYQSFVAQ